MAVSSQKFQAPKGTRDFYPADLAVRRHIENVWRQVSINHGFDEIDGPTFEHLDLYTHKSGPGIASELFQVFSGKDPEQVATIRAGENAPYALRPEFTPTLARMVAARAPELPRPIKWFAIPSHFRAESPQRGRLREFMQWNVDFIGDATSDPIASDAEVIACCVEALMKLGLGPDSVTVRLGHKGAIQELLFALDIDDPTMQRRVSDLIDAMSKRSERQQLDAAVEAGLSADVWQSIKHALAYARELARDDFLTSVRESPKGDIVIGDKKYEFHSLFRDLISLLKRLDSMELGNWCVVDPQIVRGLAYYTGTIFEIHEASGAERAIAGGGRYDKLIEGFGGPSLPACGFGMGDVVLANILKDKGLLKPAEEYLPRPDGFVIAASDEAAAKMPAIVADLRRNNLHIRQSYKTTRNVGKLLGDAGKVRARYAVILGAELTATPPRVALKDMDSGEQREVALDELTAELRTDSPLP